MWEFLHARFASPWDDKAVQSHADARRYLNAHDLSARNGSNVLQATVYAQGFSAFEDANGPRAGQGGGADPGGSKSSGTPPRDPSGEPLPREKMYDWVLGLRRHQEVRRDEIQKYYTSLFTGMLSAMPLIHEFFKMRGMTGGTSSLRGFLIMLSVAGIVIAVNWILTLMRIYHDLEGMDRMLAHMERGSSYPFINAMRMYRHKVGVPERISKQVMVIPATFLVLFVISFLHYCGIVAW